jgi:hypothetical protein
MPAPPMPNPSTGVRIQDLQRAQTPLIGTELVVMSQNGNAVVMPSSAFVGPTGSAATVTVGTTTTGAPGSSASVVQSGTPQNATLSFTVPQGLTGATGVQGPQGIPAATFRTPAFAFCPGAGMTFDVGTPTQVDSWADYTPTAMTLTNVGSNTYNPSPNTITMSGANHQMVSAGSVPTFTNPYTLIFLFKVITYGGFDHLVEFSVSGLRPYTGGATNLALTDGTNFSSGATIPASTYIPIMLAAGWHTPSAPVVNSGVVTVYDGHTGSWVQIDSMNSSAVLSGRISFHGPIGAGSGGTYEFGSLLGFNYLPNATEVANYLTILNTPTVPVPFRASTLGPVASDVLLQSAINTAPGIYGGLLRDTSASSGDQSTAIQTILTANHHIEFAEREQRTAQHLLLPDDGYINGNHALISGSASYVAVEEDWIIGITPSAVGDELQTLADPLIDKLLVTGFSVPNIRDGTNWGNGPPTKTMAGMWFGDLSGKPSGQANSIAHGRIEAGGASFCTYGIRLTGFQYSRAWDQRIGGCDVGMLVESAAGEGNVDWEINTPIMFSCLLGCMLVANSTTGGDFGPFQGTTVRGGKHNGGGVGSVCHWGCISPWWRDGTHFYGGTTTFEQNGSEFLLNDAAQYWSVGREFYTKEFNPAAGTGGYIFGNPPPANKNGRGFLRQNANNTWWMCFYVPPCSHYTEGAIVIVRDPKFSDNLGGLAGVFRAGPYGQVHIHSVSGAGAFGSRVTVADDPTAQFYLYDNGLPSGYYQNVCRWPDSLQSALSWDPFEFALVGGPLPEKELYRVTQGNQPVWHPSSLSTSHQDNISEASATRSPGFPSLLQVTGTGSATTFSVVTASEGIFSGRKVTQMVYNGTHLTTLGTCSQITASDNVQIGVNFSAASPQPGRLVVIDTEVFYIIAATAATVSSVTNGGLGYHVNDVLTVNNGVVSALPGYTSAVQVTVDTVNGSGTILTAHVSTAGMFVAGVPNFTGGFAGNNGGATFAFTTSASNIILARGQQNTQPAAHAANATVQTVGAYLDVAATGQQITTNWLGGYGSPTVPSTNVDTSAFIFIHNTSATGFWINFDAFWNGNSKYSNGNARNDTFIGRTWVGPHLHARLNLWKSNYGSDYKICWCFDALQSAVTCYVSGLMMYQSGPGLDAGTHTRIMQNGEWIRNLLQ